MFKKDFPIFSNNEKIIFLDSASSTQKPQKVIDDMQKFFTTNYANIHRGAYDWSMISSELYDNAKRKIGQFLGGVSHNEIIFTYNATYAFNLLSRGLIKSEILKKWDKILLSKAEHHANIVPWQIIAEEYGIEIIWADLHQDGTLNYDDIEAKIHEIALLSLTGASNVTGEILDMKKLWKILEKCEQKPIVVIDGSQRFPHLKTDIEAENIDFFIGTGHKIMSDTGIGFLYGKKHFLKKIHPAFCGGGAINSVRTDGYEAAGLPFRHEPGTPHIAGAISLLSALEYIESIGGYEEIEKYEKTLTEYALEKAKNLPENIHLIGSNNIHNRLGVLSFYFDNAHPNDIAEALADVGICIRAGHHCAEVLHESLNIGASLRMSLYIYNTKEDIDKFFENLYKACV